MGEEKGNMGIWWVEKKGNMKYQEFSCLQLVNGARTAEPMALKA